jgi:hypothetical protein
MEVGGVLSSQQLLHLSLTYTVEKIRILSEENSAESTKKRRLQKTLKNDFFFQGGVPKVLRNQATVTALASLRRIRLLGCLVDW